MELVTFIMRIFVLIMGSLGIVVWWTAKPRYLTDWLAGIVGVLLLFSAVWEWLR